MDQTSIILHSVKQLGMSQRQVARDLKVSRATVRRYLLGEVTPKQRKQAARPTPKYDEVMAHVARLTAAPLPGKHRWTAARLLELIRGEGHVVGATTVRRAFHELKRTKREVFIPLIYSPGELAEVDFFEVTVLLHGEPTKAFMFVMRLMHSKRDFVWLYPRQDQVSFLDGHVRAFAEWGKVPRRIAYDNLKAAVKKIVMGGRELSKRFVELTAHYTFEPTFCRPFEGHDKGGVESRGGHIRLQHMTPLLQGEILEEVSLALGQLVLAQWRGKEDSALAWESEFAEMIANAARAFDPRHYVAAAVVTASSTITVLGARYSVPTTWARSCVELFVGPETLLIIHRGESIVRQRINSGQHDIDYAAHYLRELSRKPNAVRQVATVLMEQLGDPFPALWASLVEKEGTANAARKMAHVLEALNELGREETLRRVQARQSKGESVTLLFLCKTEAPAPTIASVPENMKVSVQSTSCASFNDLLVAPSKRCAV